LRLKGAALSSSEKESCIPLLKKMTQTELLRQLHTDIKVIKTKLEVLVDHEKRLRFLERYASVLIGIALAASIIVQIIAYK